MDWEKVSQKLRAAANQHAANAEHEAQRPFVDDDKFNREILAHDIFYGLHAAIEAGLEKAE